MRGALRRAAQSRGATLLKGHAEPVIESGRAVGATVDGRRIPADVVVFAGGAWSTSLARTLGWNLPIRPQRGQILHLAMPDVRTNAWSIVTGFHSHYLLTFPPDRVVAGATHEHVGFDARVTAGGVLEALGEALRIAPGLSGAILSEVRVGFRPVSADGLPVLGRAPGLSSLLVATGHGAVGLHLGPYTAGAVSDLALGIEPPFDLAPYSPTRFDVARA